MSQATGEQLITMRAIAEATGFPLHRVRYIVSSRGVSPSRRAGQVFVFSEVQRDFIVSELHRAQADPRGNATTRPRPPERSPEQTRRH